MIKYKNQIFDIVKEFDCVTLEFGYKEGGSFFTHLPISPKNFRDEYLFRDHQKMPDKVLVVYHKDTTEFKIFDDLGRVCLVELSNDHEKEIKNAIQQAKDIWGLEVQTMGSD